MKHTDFMIFFLFLQLSELSARKPCFDFIPYGFSF